MTADHTPLATKPNDLAGASAGHAQVSAFDRHWVRGYVWTGVIAAVLVTMPTSFAEIAIIPPALFFFPMCFRTFPLWRETLARPAFLLLLALVAWLAIGLLWSTNRSLGIEELGNARFFAVALLLTPAIRVTATGRRALIKGLCIGFLVGNAVQGLNAWALHGDGPTMFLFGRAPERMSGWWDPAVAGTILTAALGLHLPSALMGQGRRRVAAACVVGVTLIGLVMTGSRGGWIASGALLVFAGCVAVARAVRHRSGRSATLATLATILVMLVVVGIVLRDPIGQRVTEAREQISAALEGDVTGYTGIRIALKHEALAAFAEHPIAGVGTGGFSDWVAERPDSTEHAVGFDHAHDTILHLAASNGIVGVGLAIAFFVAVLIDGWRWTKNRGLGTYHAGPMCALIGLGLTSPFDTLHVSATAAAVTGMVVALCIAPPRRTPYEPIDIFADDKLRR